MSEKSFRFRESYGKAIREMDDKRAGKFVKLLCAYAFEGKTPSETDVVLKSSFHLAKMVMDVEAVNRENGRKGGVASAEKRKKERGRVTIIASKPKCFEGLDGFVQELILSLAEETERTEQEEKTEQEKKV